ncbi:hypothetical protein HF1_07730 [Mycoplasma haemofelis str. Langford 1]|uniref:Uncharacterized protein n=1 Tax=Mycoplasma haemofelis (strain Langford 1) TaxID=941640 RepID=E8ZI10_MYCHL|nr:hypothetical protein [Mycoplasma haemofelis]CBY92781.1 hypothetical protein HF1_07730 [Mycoplasma haemofelis str. Langford 1]
MYLETKDIIDIVISFFKRDELKSLEMKTDTGGVFSFKSQMLSTFCNRYPPLLSKDEIRKYLKQVMQDFRGTFNPKTSEYLRDFLFFEFKKVIFVSKKTYFFNDEMERNLSSWLENPVSRNSANYKTKWVISQIINNLNSEFTNLFEITSDDRTLDLKQQLLLRYKNGFPKVKLRHLRYYLNRFLVHIASISERSIKEGAMSVVDKQYFFSELDSLFSRHKKMFIELAFYDPPSFFSRFTYRMILYAGPFIALGMLIAWFVYTIARHAN